MVQGFDLAQAQAALDYQGTLKVAQGTLKVAQGTPMAPLDTQLVVLVFQCYLSYHLSVAMLFKL
ncbi:TPA: hypothetical protein JBF52_01780 [Legionella pneumophila]|nr:hypothetical protein [Legionella pneumophila subsp. pneumophila]HAU0316787.1 hypothetical protein [Legionella pneumophila]HAT9892757.1 hypothetical protein [Legionella pneumophila subsp. pneumophila]HAU0329857.1 hypothetical protein [Legionella pneumophila]HAU0332025.1 hypothetical protein [Legionella pneumophila]